MVISASSTPRRVSGIGHAHIRKLTSSIYLAIAYHPCSPRRHHLFGSVASEPYVGVDGVGGLHCSVMGSREEDVVARVCWSPQTVRRGRVRRGQSSRLADCRERGCRRRGEIMVDRVIRGGSSKKSVMSFLCQSKGGRVRDRGRAYSCAY
jgi:hypothetical protein